MLGFRRRERVLKKKKQRLFRDYRTGLIKSYTQLIPECQLPKSTALTCYIAKIYPDTQESLDIQIVIA